MACLKMVSSKTKDLTMWQGAVVAGANDTFATYTDDWRTPDLGLTTGRCFRLNVATSSGAAYGVVAHAAGAIVYARIGFKINTLTSSSIYIGRLFEDTVEHLSLRLVPSTGVLSVYRSTTLLGSSAAAALPLATWCVIEMYAKIADSGGEVTVKVNGTAVITLTSQDTRNAGTAGTVNSQYWGLCSGAPNPCELLVDDLMIRDDAFCGVGGLWLLPVTGNGADQDWTPSSGSAWDCIDELPAAAADYIYQDAGTAGERAIFDVANLPVDPTAITCVAVFARARLTLPGVGSVKTCMKSDATLAYGSAVALDVGAQWVAQYNDEDPDGPTAWTKAAVDALKIGVESV